MNWTTDNPTKQGVYWVKKSEMLPEIAYFSGQHFYVTGHEWDLSFSDFNYFYGPIELPEFYVEYKASHATFNAKPNNDKG